jgi:hypothetical protein
MVRQEYADNFRRPFGAVIFVATVVVNTPDAIEFANISENAKQNQPTLSVQVGEWEADNRVDVGVVVDTYGSQLPILTSNDARKLAKWLVRAADILDGVKNSAKKSRPRTHYEVDDPDDY